MKKALLLLLLLPITLGFLAGCSMEKGMESSMQSKEDLNEGTLAIMTVPFGMPLDYNCGDLFPADLDSFHTFGLCKTAL